MLAPKASPCATAFHPDTSANCSGSKARHCRHSCWKKDFAEPRGCCLRRCITIARSAPLPMTWVFVTCPTSTGRSIAVRHESDRTLATGNDSGRKSVSLEVHKAVLVPSRHGHGPAPSKRGPATADSVLSGTLAQERYAVTGPNDRTAGAVDNAGLVSETSCRLELAWHLRCSSNSPLWE